MRRACRQSTTPLRSHGDRWEGDRCQGPTSTLFPPGSVPICLMSLSRKLLQSRVRRALWESSYLIPTSPERALGQAWALAPLRPFRWLNTVTDGEPASPGFLSPLCREEAVTRGVDAHAGFHQQVTVSPRTLFPRSLCILVVSINKSISGGKPGRIYFIFIHILLSGVGNSLCMQ